MKQAACIRTTLILTTLMAAGAPAMAGETASESVRMHIGATGISCVTEPCPWRGVVLPQDEARDSLRPWWSGSAVPKLIGEEEDVVRIEQAWDAMHCLAIEGAVIEPARADAPPVVRVDRVVGDCA